MTHRMPSCLPVIEKISQINAAFLTSRPICAIIHPLKKDTLTANPSSPGMALSLLIPARILLATDCQPGVVGTVAPDRPQAGIVILATGCGVMDAVQAPGTSGTYLRSSMMKAMAKKI